MSQPNANEEFFDSVYRRLAGLLAETIDVADGGVEARHLSRLISQAVAYAGAISDEGGKDGDGLADEPELPLGAVICFPPTTRFAGSDSSRQAIGRPGHCEGCAKLGHVAAHPDLGCGDVQCTSAHSPELVDFEASNHDNVADVDADDDFLDDFDDDPDDDDFDDEEELPSELRLHLRLASGLYLSPTVAGQALQLVLPTLREEMGCAVIGELELDDIDDRHDIRHVTLSADPARLARFEASIPLPGAGIVEVTSTIGGDTDDTDQVPDAGDPCTYEDEDLIVAFQVVYTRADGEPLTAEQVNEIAEHPISGGIRRFGETVLIGTEPGLTPASRIGRFEVVDDSGDVNLNALAAGVVAYRGSFDFGPGIGLVHAEGIVEDQRSSVEA